MTDYDSGSSSESFDPLNIKNDNEEGWDDVEPDYEPQNVVCLFCEENFDNVSAMLLHCKEKNNFDLMKTRKELVNYLRSEARQGRNYSAVTTTDVFADDDYLKPVLEDDPLLYSLDDLDDEPISGSTDDSTAQVEELRQQLQELKVQFAEYQEQVSKILQSQLESKESISPAVKPDPQPPRTSDHAVREFDYFDSYSYNSIHETMLKDTVRTDAYRDFIYDNKHLFQNKVVLDVGCGTGILSMFCAKAGAKLVIAVDNSNIIEKANANVAENGLSDIITCLRGKIEEVTLPVPQVDIIVSEWMGYALFYEAMFDSVIWARDHYLKPDGLLVPSHTSLFLAPISDSDLIASNFHFWDSVYGFKMSSMQETVRNEVLIQSATPDSLISRTPSPFLELNLHTTKVSDLTFNRPFSLTVDLTQDSSSSTTLDGFLIYFDIFFLPSRTSSPPPSGSTALQMQKKGHVAFTTGPDAKQTHWQQAILLLDHDNAPSSSTTTTPSPEISKGQVIKGNVSYRKRSEKSRGLEIEVDWWYGDDEKERKLENVRHGEHIWYLG
ncbi:putative s-adenosylmethionine-dependent methyltransferase superfamily domain-containing protein [Phaeomoniella chlamydospora]|uniref:type I protein arginine methyltransferase n=1 Tax=Phaeomoniella chlamydospora TaxID=158046 RepID=A0A0G2DTC2_PHACM|nr:putative s-adenosylmethionine-dependent methyltransferase superfamily domain-containing protein [Phaeomoniella chlamydospora]